MGRQVGSAWCTFQVPLDKRTLVIGTGNTLDLRLRGLSEILEKFNLIIPGATEAINRDVPNNRALRLVPGAIGFALSVLYRFFGRENFGHTLRRTLWNAGTTARRTTPRSTVPQRAVPHKAPARRRNYNEIKPEMLPANTFNLYLCD